MYISGSQRDEILALSAELKVLTRTTTSLNSLPPLPRPSPQRQLRRLLALDELPSWTPVVPDKEAHKRRLSGTGSPFHSQTV